MTSDFNYSVGLVYIILKCVVWFKGFFMRSAVNLIYSIHDLL